MPVARVPAGRRDRLERLCRYARRPPLAEERITTTPDGDVAVQLRRPWADGTTHLVFEPRAFLGRLAVLVPRPRVNLVLYHGVLGPRAAWRREVVPTVASQAIGVATADQPPAENLTSGGRGWRWADLMRRVFAVDVLACARCGGRLRLIATLAPSDTTRRILRHLALPTVGATANARPRSAWRRRLDCLTCSLVVCPSRVRRERRGVPLPEAHPTGERSHRHTRSAEP